MIRLLRGVLAAAVALFIAAPFAQAQTFTQLAWGISRGATPSPICMMNGPICLGQIGTLNVTTNRFTPNTPRVYLDTFDGDPSCNTNLSCVASDAAITAAYAYITANYPSGATIVGSAGKYKFNSQIVLSLASARQNISFVGQGQNATTFYWPNAAGGLKFTFNSCSNSVSISDITFTTGVASGGEGVGLYAGAGYISCPGGGNQAISLNTFNRVTFRGDDGLSTNQYWTSDSATHAVSRINWESCNLFGGNPSGVAAGRGISLEGIPASSTYGIVYNINNSYIIQHDQNVYYGDFVQGVTMTNNNISYGRTAIETVANAVGTLAELNLKGNQIAILTGTVVNLQSPMFAYNATGNLLSAAAGQTVVNMPHPVPFVSEGNQLNATGPADGSTGYNFGASPIAGGSVLADDFQALQTAINLGAGSAYITVGRNNFHNNGADVVNSGTGNIVDQSNTWSDKQNVGGEYVGSHGGPVSIGPNGAGNSAGSQPLHFWGRDSGGGLNAFAVGGDANGDGVLIPGAGGLISLLDSSGNVVLQTVAGKVVAKKPINFSGSTSGSTDLQASATASGVLTLPAATDTLTGKATTDTLTNKTYDTAGTGNSFSINGLAATANTGTGAVARAVSPSFTTPALGTPSAVTLTNGTGLPTTGLTGTLQAAQEPAHTGDVTNSAGSLALTIAANAVTNAKAAQMAANTIKGNNTAGTANAADLTVPQVAAMLSAPQTCFIISTSAVTCNNGGSAANNGTYTTPTNAKYLIAEEVGGGGGSAGSGTGATNGGAGGDTTFSTATAGGGSGGKTAAASTGGAPSGCDVALSGGVGASPSTATPSSGGSAGDSFYGGGGPVGPISGGAGFPAAANSGSGASGAGTSGTANTGGGGAAGAYCRKLITSPAATLSYSVGAAGTAGAAGTGGFAGAVGGSGNISVTAYFQ